MTDYKFTLKYADRDEAIRACREQWVTLKTKPHIKAGGCVVYDSKGVPFRMWAPINNRPHFVAGRICRAHIMQS